MTLADEKEALATIFFECARYERPSTEWIAALDLFVTKVAETEREACAVLCDWERSTPERGTVARHLGARIRERSNAETTGLSG